MGDLARWGLCGIPSGARHNRHRLGEPLRERCVDLDLKRTTSQPGITAFVIFHVVAFDDWLAVPDRVACQNSLQV